MLRIPVGFFAALPQARNVTFGPKKPAKDPVSRDTVETFRALLHSASIVRCKRHTNVGAESSLVDCPLGMQKMCSPKGFWCRIVIVATVTAKEKVHKQP